jgi:hypothetical protein
MCSSSFQNYLREYCSRNNLDVSMYNNSRKGSNKKVVIGKNSPAKAIFNQPNYIKGGKAPPKNLPRNKHSQSFNFQKHFDDYPDFKKIDRRCISHDMISLMNGYDILRGINRKSFQLMNYNYYFHCLLTLEIKVPSSLILARAKQ